MVNGIKRYLDKVNGLQIKGIAALYHLCVQVETKSFHDTMYRTQCKVEILLLSIFIV